jgi:hypothetical protein
MPSSSSVIPGIAETSPRPILAAEERRKSE